jgi:hypothetical protein
MKSPSKAYFPPYLGGSKEYTLLDLVFYFPKTSGISICMMNTSRRRLAHRTLVTLFAAIMLVIGISQVQAQPLPSGPFTRYNNSGNTDWNHIPSWLTSFTSGGVPLTNALNGTPGAGMLTGASVYIGNETELPGTSDILGLTVNANISLDLDQVTIGQISAASHVNVTGGVMDVNTIDLINGTFTVSTGQLGSSGNSVGSIIIGSGSTANLNGRSFVNAVNSSGILNVGDMANIASVEGGTLNLNGSGVLLGGDGNGDLSLTDVTFNRAGGSFNVRDLTLNNTSVVELTASDSISGALTLTGDATVTSSDTTLALTGLAVTASDTFTFTQLLDAEDGLTILGGANAISIAPGHFITLDFDANTVPNSGDWILRWFGNWVTEATAFIDDGQFQSNFDIEAVLGTDGYTYITAGITAVPEPVACLGVAVSLICGSYYRPRRRAA